MMRLGLVLLGVAILLRGRKAMAGEEEKESEVDPDSNAEAPPAAPFYKETVPMLDNAIWENPLLIGPGARGDLGWNLGLGSNLGQTPGTGFGGVPQILPQGLGSGQTIGATTPDQLSAAHHMYQQIVGAIPSAITQKIANVKALADFQSRVAQQHLSVAKKVVSWHKKVFHF